MRRLLMLTAALLVCAGAAERANAGFVVFSGSGPNPAAISATVDSFRTALGSLNPNDPTSFASGRREINWDGVPEGSSDPNAFPGDFFNGTVPGRARGISLSTPGTGFLVSANAGASTPPLFGFPNDFQAFSAQKVFTAVNSNITDVTFFVPGTTTAATTSGFGAVFTDVEVSGLSKIELFDSLNNSLFSANVPTSDNQGLSFLGIYGNAGERISRVRITSGLNTIVANGQLGNQNDDVVAMDDFIYGEPQAAIAAVPEPATLALAAIGGLGLLFRFRRQSTTGFQPVA